MLCCKHTPTGNQHSSEGSRDVLKSYPSCVDQYTAASCCNTAIACSQCTDLLNLHHKQLLQQCYASTNTGSASAIQQLHTWQQYCFS